MNEKGCETRYCYGVRRILGERASSDADAAEILDEWTACKYTVHTRDFLAEKWHCLEVARGLVKANTRQSADAFFCSELVAALLQRLGILDPHVLPNNVMPSPATHSPFG